MRHPGYLVESILWHLLEEGNLSLARLATRIGRPPEHIRRVLIKMRTLGQVQIPAHLIGSHGCVRQYGLTHCGATAALQLERAQVEFAADTVQEACV